MRLLKTHSRTSERLGYEARKNAKKSNWRKRRHYTKANHRQKSPAYHQRGGGGETKKGELKENTGAKKGNQSQNPPAGYHRGGGARQKSKTNTKWKGGTTHSPATGGEAPSRKRIAERKQNNVHHKENKKKHTVLCHCVSNQITLAAPWFGAEDGVCRTTKKRKTAPACAKYA